MASTQLLDQKVQNGITNGKHETKLAQEMERILEEADGNQPVESPEKLQWGYRIPFAGVRYYTF